MKIKGIMIIFIIILTATPVSLGGCSFKETETDMTQTPSTEGAAVTEPAGTHEAVLTQNADNDFELEKNILGGTPCRINAAGLISEGCSIDVDCDGVKDILKAEKREDYDLSGTYVVTVNGEPADVCFTEDDELWFFSTLGSSIEIAQKNENELEYAVFCNCAGERAEVPADGVPAYRVTCLKQTPVHADECCLIIYADSMDKVVHRGSIEEYLMDGATCGLSFPLLVSVNDELDKSIELDLDGDGTREELLFKSGRILIYNKGDTTSPIKEIPYRLLEEDGMELIERYRAEGYDTGLDERMRFFVNGKEFVREDGRALVYEQRSFFAPNHEGGIRLISGVSGWIEVGWKNGEFNYRIVSSGEV